MEQKVCLDTDVVIGLLKGEPRASKLLDVFRQSRLFLSSVSFFELLLREWGLADVEKIRAGVSLLEFDEPSARAAAALLKDLKKKGRLVDNRDLFIAASCVAHGCNLATFNVRHFAPVKGLVLVRPR